MWSKKLLDSAVCPQSHFGAFILNRSWSLPLVIESSWTDGSARSEGA